MLTFSHYGVGWMLRASVFSKLRPSLVSAASANQQRENEVSKLAEHNFCNEICRMIIVIHRRPRAIYELEDLNGTPIDFLFYQEKPTPVG